MHLSIESVFIGAISTALAFHALRFAAAPMARSSNKIVSNVGNAVGAFFTFGGN